MKVYINVVLFLLLVLAELTFYPNMISSKSYLQPAMAVVLLLILLPVKWYWGIKITKLIKNTKV